MCPIFVSSYLEQCCLFSSPANESTTNVDAFLFELDNITSSIIRARRSTNSTGKITHKHVRGSKRDYPNKIKTSRNTKHILQHCHSLALPRAVVRSFIDVARRDFRFGQDLFQLLHRRANVQERSRLQTRLGVRAPVHPDRRHSAQRERERERERNVRAARVSRSSANVRPLSRALGRRWTDSPRGLGRSRVAGTVSHVHALVRTKS